MLIHQWNLLYSERKKVILTERDQSLVELILDPGFRIIEEYLSQIDSQYQVNLTQIFANYLEIRVKF